MRCIAHRGFASVNPENTLPGIEAAVEAGADAVEVDVRRCATGEVVVCHDETVDRVTDGSGAVAELSRSALAELDVLGTGTGVPTLAAVTETLGPDVGLNVELKERDLAADVASLLAGSGLEVLLSAFDPAALREAATDASDLDRALLVGPEAIEAGASDRIDGPPLDLARRLGCVAVHPHLDACDEAVVGRAHDRGLRVNAWTVRDADTAIDLRQAGVDGVIADAPAACL